MYNQFYEKYKNRSIFKQLGDFFRYMFRKQKTYEGEELTNNLSTSNSDKSTNLISNKEEDDSIIKLQW